MLFTWIDKKSVLSRAKAEESSPELRQRWATQITRSLAELHKHSIIWGDAKAENILIDRNDDAWIIDFGGSYTVGWVDKEKAGTLEGDMQGLSKILEMLKL
jgi:serine/threonine protein kinase